MPSHDPTDLLGGASPHGGEGGVEAKGARVTHGTVLVLFFLSGACGLVYEVVWMRMLTLVFGATAFAAAAILASYFAGLALGSLLFGRLADRSRNPLAL